MRTAGQAHHQREFSTPDYDDERSHGRNGDFKPTPTGEPIRTPHPHSTDR